MFQDDYRKIAINSKVGQSNFNSVSRSAVDRARESFIDCGGNVKGLPVRSFISSSWSRCMAEGVNPENMVAPLVASEETLYKERHKNSSLLECARPVLEKSGFMLQDLETLIILADDSGLSLQVIGDQRTLYAGNGIGLVPGCGWEENISGSNAVGTAIATGLPTQVHGEEHFCKGFKPWTCTAATIKDPYDDQLIGVIDISGLANEFNRFHVPLVVSWASEIHMNLSKLAMEQWQFIQDHSNKNFSKYSNCGKLLLDKSGRLISYSENARPMLKSLGIDYNPSTKRRLSLEGFGGEEIIYPHDSGHWVLGDWVEPIKDKGDILGFQILIPAGKSGMRKAPIASPSISSAPETNGDPFSKIYSKTISFETIVDKARTAATSPLPILLLGDTGVGKEVFAKAIHEFSNYSKGTFVDLNCGGLNKDILNSELFGHVEGAFTGAKKGGMKGKIEAANGGTLFLDEIGEMPLEMQPIFLRVLQDNKIYRLGDIKPIPVNFRLIAATNRDLKKDVEDGRFRRDLYFRLSTVTIGLEPLASRKEDIEGISLLVLNRVRKTHSIVPKFLSPSLLLTLKGMEWPGNIRELVNVIEYMCFMSQNETLTVDDLPDGYGIQKAVFDHRAHSYQAVQPQSSPTTEQISTAIEKSSLDGAQVNIGNTQPSSYSIPPSLDVAEKQVIRGAIERAEGNMSKAARILGIAKSTLYQKVKKYRLTKVG